MQEVVLQVVGLPAADLSIAAYQADAPPLPIAADLSNAVDSPNTVHSPTVAAALAAIPAVDLTADLAAIPAVVLADTVAADSTVVAQVADKVQRLSNTQWRGVEAAPLFFTKYLRAG
jgi:hypothetical protein